MIENQESQNGKINNLCKKDVEDKRNVLKELCTNNADYFSRDSSENGQRLYISFLAMNDAVDALWPKISNIEAHVSEFDFDEETPGNGYRSYLHVVNLAIDLAIDLNKKVLFRRDSVLFRKTTLTKDVESCSHLLTSLDICLKHLETLLTWSDKGNLFVREEHTPEELLTKCGEINQHCFYGRHLGFQYCDSLKNILQFIALSMTLFSEVYYSQGSLISKATNSVMSTTKYITDPEQRARRIVNISQNAEVDFCKAFWFLSETELMNQLPSIVSNSVAVSKVIFLPPEPLTITVGEEEIEIPVPSSHIGQKPIQIRLISHKIRSGMLGTKNKTQLEPPAKGLLIHCHGGGFVAQSSKSHDGYLRDWAKDLDVPILCVDYSLAPEAPYPRALEEVLYAYCWAKKNSSLLGSTGETVVGAGDSAGANLLLCTTLKCLHMNIPPPNGLFVAYVPTGIHFLPSPARLLCMMDPLLPFGFLMRCLKAYAFPDRKSKRKTTNSNSDTESFEEISESDLLELQAHKSPISDTSDTLTYGSLSSNVEDVNNGNTADLTVSDVEKQQKCVSEFLEKYVLESDTETDGAKISVLKQGSSSTSASNLDNSIQNRVSAMVSNLKNHFTKFLGATENLDVDTQSNMVDKFQFTVPKDHFLSPIFATDEDLKKFPPVRVLSVHLDPCLDDCVMFAKRLKKVDNNVKLDILNGLPHGFLNFSLLSKDAYEGSKVCIERIRELLNLDNLPPPQ
ncbi:hormone-sensitive lipase isoform X2 [Anoplophora glabripennis]|uniref:hormone-sensitive lipase isoform X2 n=1 Tax=Anoplophora glabripennis TaxID=217634 RepID=UPI000873FC31|nr:hormone-sensitive lipase isoform X2 [Anoplophora glabripennis]